MTGRRAILVTGGAGFIGSHTCKALLAAGYAPITLDNLSTGHADAVRYGPLIPGDVRDADQVARALMYHGCAAVIHFAGSAYVGESMTNPGKYYQTNVGGMIGLLKGCEMAGVTRIVFSSSCATYGIPDQLPIRESTPLRPINPYGRSKAICEAMLADYAAATGLRYGALRYFNAAGADPDGELAERHDPETHLLPLALRAASGLGDPLQVFGSDYPTPDGTCVRDYIHVADLAQAHVRALALLLEGHDSFVVNLGTGVGRSIREILAAIKRISGASVPVLWQPRRPGDPPALVADPARALQVLGFTPQMSALPTILAHAAPSFGLQLQGA